MANMTSSRFIIALVATTIVVGAQTQIANPGAKKDIKKQPASQTSTPYAIVTNDANSRVWERTVYEQGPNGTATLKKQRYTELATGMYYKNKGKWVESERKWVNDGNSKSYWSGWHVLPTKAVAEAYLTRFKNRRDKLVILRCNIKGNVWPKAHANAPVVLAQFLKLI